LSNHQEVATKISEALKAAAQCSAAETVENYSVLSEHFGNSIPYTRFLGGPLH